MNVREISNDEPDLHCGGNLILFDLIVKHLPRILALLNLLDVEFATSDHSVGGRDNKLEAPIHRHESASMHQRHPKRLAIISVLSEEIGTCCISRVGTPDLIKLPIVHRLDPEIIKDR
jgi:hypothetical protein